MYTYPQLAHRPTRQTFVRQSRSNCSLLWLFPSYAGQGCHFFERRLPQTQVFFLEYIAFTRWKTGIGISKECSYMKIKIGIQKRNIHWTVSYEFRKNLVFFVHIFLFLTLDTQKLVKMVGSSYFLINWVILLKKCKMLRNFDENSWENQVL